MFSVFTAELPDPEIPGEIIPAERVNNLAYSDILFKVEGHAVRANKAIVSTRAVYFQAMFASQWRESDQV